MCVWGESWEKFSKFFQKRNVLGIRWSQKVEKYFMAWSIVRLPKPPSKDEEKVQMERGRAGTFLLGFPEAVSVHPHQEKVCWSKAKPEVAFGDMLQCNPKVVVDEGQRARAFAKSYPNCWLFLPG